MASRPLAVLAVAALLVLAGCSGAGPGGGPTNDDGGAAGAAGGDAPSPTPTPTGPVYELPSSGDALAAAHDEALREAGSFTAETNVTSRDGETGRTLSVVATTAVDVEADTALMRATVGGADQTVYVAADGTAYQRTTTGDTATYQRLEAAPDLTGFYELPVAPLVDRATLVHVGRDRVGGVAVSVYEVTDLEALVTPGQVGSVGSVGVESLESFEVRLAIDDHGLVRDLYYHVEVDLDGATRAITMRVTYTDLGATAVERPDWVDEAA